MKRTIVTLGITLTVLLSGVVGFLISKRTSKGHVIDEIQLIQTAYMVVHPGANKGETIIFPALSETGVTTYVDFPLQSPCAESELTGTPAHPPRCEVTADVTEKNLAQYPFSIGRQPLLEQGKSRCQWACCPGCLIVVPNPVHPIGSIPIGGIGSGPYAAIEILIDNSDNGGVEAQNAAAYPGQPVQWFRSGTVDTEWSVTFEDPTACLEKKPIGSGILKSPVCTVAGNISSSPYKYTMNVGGKTGTGLLYVNPPIPLVAASK